MIFSVGDLVRLGRLYCARHQIKPATLGSRAIGNNRVFIRLFAGLGCRSDTAERLSLWFVQHWPDDVPWPSDIPRLRAETVLRIEHYEVPRQECAA